MIFPTADDQARLDFLLGMTFTQWVKLAFDHPVTEPPWYQGDEWRDYFLFSPNDDAKERIIRFATHLFQSPNESLQTYTVEQIDEGFNFIWLDFTVGLPSFLLYDQKISWELRRECVLAMQNLFAELFSKIPESGACTMWWDNYRDFEDRYNPQIEDVMFDVMSRILEMPERHCQWSALHGLGHHNHPKRATLIENYLKTNPQLDDNIKQYAKYAMEGRVL